MFRLRFDPNGLSRMIAQERVFTFRALFLGVPCVLASGIGLLLLTSFEKLSREGLVLCAAPLGVFFVAAVIMVLTEFGILLPIEATNDSTRKLETFSLVLELLGTKSKDVVPRIENLVAVENELSDLEHRVSQLIPHSPPKKKKKGKNKKKNAQSVQAWKPLSLAERIGLLSEELLQLRANRKGGEVERDAEIRRLKQERDNATNSRATKEARLFEAKEKLATCEAELKTLRSEKQEAQRRLAEYPAERATFQASISRLENRIADLEATLASERESAESQLSEAHDRREELRRTHRGELVAAEVALERAQIHRLELSERFHFRLRSLSQIEQRLNAGTVMARNVKKIRELLELFETRLFFASLFAQDEKWDWVETLCLPARLPDAFDEILQGLPADAIALAERRFGVS